MENRGNIIDRLLNIFTKIIEFIVIISVGVLTLTLIINVFFRYVLGSPIVGADEIALLLLVWITFLGTCLSIQRRDMIAVTFIIDKFSIKVYKYVQMFIQLSIVLFSALFLNIGAQWLTSSNVMNASSHALQIPLWMPYAIFPVSMFIMLVFACNNIRLVLKGKKEGDQ